MASRRRDDESYRRFLVYIGECGLEPGLRSICLKHAVTPRDIYLDATGETIHAARLEVWWWLAQEHRKSSSEIGRMFDREPSSILYALKKLSEEARHLVGIYNGNELMHESAKAVAKNVAMARRRTGEQSAERFAAKRAARLRGE